MLAGVRKPMDKYGVIIILVAAGTLIAWIYYFFFKLSVAIWAPTKAKKEWLEISESPGIKAFHSFFKWVAPSWVIMATAYLVIATITFTMEKMQ